MAAFDFNQLAVVFATQADRQAFLKPLNEVGLMQFKTFSFPTRKTEDWKYTSLNALTKENYNQAIDHSNINTADVNAFEALYDVAELNANRLVFVNGVYQSELSNIEPQTGVTLVTFANATAAQQAEIAEKIGTLAEVDRNLFTALNNAQVNDGVYLNVEKNVQVIKPVQVVHITKAQASAGSAFSRCLVQLGVHANATLIEQFVSTDQQQNVLFNQTTEAVIGDGAKLNHYRLNSEHESSLHFGGVYVDLNRDSQFESYQILLGGQIKRLDVLVNHSVGGSHCEMTGVYLPKNNQQVDIHSYIEHKAPNCTTNENYRGIMADQSKAVFNGRIHIHKDAQKTLAELSNKNLLLSNKAQINTKPELEIYADDVRCAHGATVAQLNETAKFYLRSRGISAQEADIILSFGFINELLESIPLDALREKMRPLMAQQFTSNRELTKHILHDEGENA
jgi:Fe-S cluster assembly protein SufD